MYSITFRNMKIIRKDVLKIEVKTTYTPVGTQTEHMLLKN